MLPLSADGQLAGLVQYLQKRLRTLEGENTSLEQVVSRLKNDVEAATRRASQAEQARLETAEQLRNSLRTQEQHERQMQQVQELNLLRESNVTLRSVFIVIKYCAHRAQQDVCVWLARVCKPLSLHACALSQFLSVVCTAWIPLFWCTTAATQLCQHPAETAMPVVCFRLLLLLANRCNHAHCQPMQPCSQPTNATMLTAFLSF